MLAAVALKRFDFTDFKHRDLTRRCIYKILLELFAVLRPLRKARIRALLWNTRGESLRQSLNRFHASTPMCALRSGRKTANNSSNIL